MRVENINFLAHGETLEFHRIMRAICQGNYLNLTEEQMRKGYLGYMSEDDEFLTREQDEFGLSYKSAAPHQRSSVLVDRCQGRPTYEWQVPAGMDRYYGFKSVSTAVDVNYTDAINENDIYDWELTGEQISMKGKHYIVKNNSTGAKLCLCTVDDSAEALDKFENIDTYAAMYAADRLLTSTDSPFSPRSQDDYDAWKLCVGWSALAYYTGHFAAHPIIFGGLNIFLLLRTFFIPEEIRLKNILRKCRQKELHVVYGDWLTPDWIEREQHTSDHDIANIAERYGMFGVGNDSARGEYMLEGSKFKAWVYKFLINLELRGLINPKQE
eukprot:UN29880